MQHYHDMPAATLHLACLVLATEFQIIAAYVPHHYLYGLCRAKLSTGILPCIVCLAVMTALTKT